MNRRKMVKISAIIIMAALLLLINTPPLTRRMPGDINVILLTVDSLRPDHLGCYDYGKTTSPNIDAIADKGQLFRRAYSQSVWTIPGLMSVLTSLQPPVHRVEQRGDILDPRTTTIFDCFRDAGYEVPNICFLLTIPEFSGIRIGPVEERYFSEEDDEELFRWLDENQGAKFFLWYHYRNVHLPYRPQEGSSKISPTKLSDEGLLSPGVEAVLSESAVVPVGTVKFEQSDRPIIEDLYDGEVRDLDKFMGRLYARLKKYGLLRKTLIVITADHGEELFDHGFVGHASTMHSATIYDEVIRIPLIMSLADYLPGRVEVREQVQQIDIMPTILDIVKIPIPPGVQGRSMAPVFFDVRKRNESSIPVFAETVYGGFHATEEMAKTRLRCVRTDAWKLIETDGPQGKTFQLFDLLLDPNELQNVYAENPQVASLLKTLLAEWERENGIRRKVVEAGATSVAPADGQGACPQIIFPCDGAVLRFSERGGTIRSSWTGSPASTYIVEYEIGTGVHRLTGSFLTFGNQRDFGPYSREIWNPLVVRNPWRVRVSPDTQPRCWSEWIQFTFE
jgi:arylsulfatase A-like enzyme